MDTLIRAIDLVLVPNKKGPNKSAMSKKRKVSSDASDVKDKKAKPQESEEELDARVEEIAKQAEEIAKLPPDEFQKIINKMVNREKINEEVEWNLIHILIKAHLEYQKQLLKIEKQSLEINFTVLSDGHIIAHI